MNFDYAKSQAKRHAAPILESLETLSCGRRKPLIINSIAGAGGLFVARNIIPDVPKLILNIPLFLSGWQRRGSLDEYTLSLLTPFLASNLGDKKAVVVIESLTHEDSKSEVIDLITDLIVSNKINGKPLGPNVQFITSNILNDNCHFFPQAVTDVSTTYRL